MVPPSEAPAMLEREPLGSLDVDWTASGREVTARAMAGLRKLVVVALVAGWVTFWGLVMRVQVTQQEFVSATVVGVLFVLPAVVGLTGYLYRLPDPRRLVPT